MLDALDAILTLVEPGGTTDPATDRRTATSGVVVDHRGETPAEVWDANTLYGQIISDAHQPPDLTDREDFVVELVRVLASADEETQQRRLRSVSDDLDDAAHAYIAILDANRARGVGRPWEYLTTIVVDWDRLRRFNERAIAIRITGWRYREAS